jgi:hypothetical protein
MTPDQTVIFVETFYHHATAMGWNQGIKQITIFNNSAGKPIDIIKCYGQTDKATLKIGCERFCKVWQIDAQDCAE